MNTYKAAGMLIGITVGLIITFFLFKFFNRDGKVRTEYDEMQEAIRGKAYRLAFFVLIIGIAVLMLIDIAGIALPMENSVMYFTLLMIGVAVQAGYSILHGAYFGLNNNKKRFWGIMGVVTAINLLCGVRAIAAGEMLVDGKLQDPFINLLCALLFVFIGIMMLIPRKAEEE